MHTHGDLLLGDGWFALPERAIWHAEERCIVLSDLHLGFETAVSSQGRYMPEFARPVIDAAWDKLMARGPKRVVIAGDLFHANSPDAKTLQHARQLLSRVPSGCQVTALPGNHDPGVPTLSALLEGTCVKVQRQTDVAGWRIAHGHELEDARKSLSLPLLDADAAPAVRGFIVGHQHPAIRLADRVQTARMLCFAAIKADAAAGYDTPMILLPHFSPGPMGSNLLTSSYWIIDAPFPPAANVRVAGIVRDRVLDFGRLDELSIMNYQL